MSKARDFFKLRTFMTKLWITDDVQKIYLKKKSVRQGAALNFLPPSSSFLNKSLFFNPDPNRRGGKEKKILWS